MLSWSMLNLFSGKVCHVRILHLNISLSFLDFRFDKGVQQNLAPKCWYKLSADMYINACLCTHANTCSHNCITNSNHIAIAYILLPTDSPNHLYIYYKCIYVNKYDII